MTETPDNAVPPVAGDPSATRPTVGRVALIAAAVLIVSSVAISIILGVLGAPYVIRDSSGPRFNFLFGDPDPTVSALGLASPVHVLLGSLVGVWVIVQSIVAISVNRGRTAAIVAIVLAVVVPGVSLVIYLLIMLLPR